MAEKLKIAFLEVAQKKQAISLLSKAFNAAVDDMTSGFDTEHTNDNIAPVTFTASIGDKVVGVIRCAYYDPAYAGLFCLAVEPTYRQQGIGHALMNYAEDYISTEWMRGNPGIISLWDETKRKNPSSTYYEKMGYQMTPYEERNEDGLPCLYKRVNTDPIPPRQKPDRRPGSRG